MVNTILEQQKPLYLYVLDKNVKAIGFYEKMGFKYSGEKEFLDSGFFMLKYVRI